MKPHVELAARTIHLDVVAARLRVRADYADRRGHYTVCFAIDEIRSLASDLQKAADDSRSAHSQLITTGNE